MERLLLFWTFKADTYKYLHRPMRVREGQQSSACGSHTLMLTGRSCCLGRVVWGAAGCRLGRKTVFTPALSGA